MKEKSLSSLNGLGALAGSLVVALAGGALNFSLRYAYVYRKEDKAGGRNEIQIPLRDILKRKASDFVLQPENQTKDGYFGKAPSDNARMYDTKDDVCTNFQT